MSKISITPNPSGTGVFTISSPATSTDRTLTLPDEAGTVLTSASSITQNAGPVCFVYRSGSNQSLTQNAYTIIQYNNVITDTDSAWDNSNYRFSPSVAGYYMIQSQFQTGAADPTRLIIHHLRNGSNAVAWSSQAHDLPVSHYGITATSTIYLNGSGDYVDTRMYTQTAGVQIEFENVGSGRYSFFKAILLRAG